MPEESVTRNAINLLSEENFAQSRRLRRGGVVVVSAYIISLWPVFLASSAIIRSRKGVSAR